MLVAPILIHYVFVILIGRLSDLALLLSQFSVLDGRFHDVLDSNLLRLALFFESIPGVIDQAVF